MFHALEWSNPGNPGRSTATTIYGELYELPVLPLHLGYHTHIPDACSKALRSTFHFLANQMAGVKASFPLKIGNFLRGNFIFQPWIFRGHVSFWGVSPFWKGIVVNRCHECIFVFTVYHVCPIQFLKRKYHTVPIKRSHRIIFRSKTPNCTKHCLPKLGTIN